jgi:hypothetical protein
MVLSIATEKSPVTPPGIDPETVRLVVQCLNHYATPGPERAPYIITEVIIFVSVYARKNRTS